MLKIKNKTLSITTMGCLLLLNSVIASADCRIADLYQTAAPERFQAQNNGTVTDDITGLMWRTCVLGLSGDLCQTGEAKTMSWDEGADAAGLDNTAGFTNWRLPNIKELSSLIEYSCIDPALNTTLFPNPGRLLIEANRQEYTTWSSTPYYDSGAIRYIDFANGADNSNSRTAKELIRLVRDVDSK